MGQKYFKISYLNIVSIINKYRKQLVKETRKNKIAADSR